MAIIPIWPGSSSFGAGATPFSFYDEDTDFQVDAPLVAGWCATRLGYPLVDIELQAVNFFTAFEEAINEYGKQLYDFQIINNFQTFEGNPTGSLGPTLTPSSSFNNRLITPNLGGIINISEQYGAEVDGGGGNQKLESGNLSVSKGVQKYDLLGSASSSLFGPNSTSPGNEIYVKKIYHYAPTAINRYFDPYAGTGTGIQSLMETFGFGNYSPGVNFMLMPIYFDTLKIQAIELNDTIRKSGYHFTIEDNRYLKLFPIPTRNYKLYFDFIYKQDATNPILRDSELSARGLITDISNVPYSHPTYSTINQPGRQWIRKYTLALSKEMLGSIRGKYQALPIPGETTTLDYSRLLSEAAAEKIALIEELKALLEETTRLKQLERKNQEAQQAQETFYKTPYHIYIG